MGYEIIAYAVIAAASAGVAAYSSYQSGKATEEQGKYNAKVAANNQRSTQQQADADLARVREKYRRVRGSQVAAAGVSGMSGSSSFSDLLADTNLQEDLDSLGLLYQAKSGIIGQEARKKASLMEGAQGMAEGYYGAAGSLLSSAGSFYGNYPTVAN